MSGKEIPNNFLRKRRHEKLKNLRFLLLGIILILGAAFITACGNNNAELEELRQQLNEAEQEARWLERDLERAEEQIEALTRELERAEEQVEELIRASEQEQQTGEAPADGNQSIVGEWRMTVAPEEPYISGMAHGWMYDMFFFADGTGIEWWFEPDAGWHEAYHFTWTLLGEDQVTITITWANEALFEEFLGLGAEVIDSIINTSVVSIFSVAGDTLTFYGLGATYQRN